MSREWIVISGARQHNLKNVTVRLPRRALSVITGLSGSGKSSLAFDTLYAEGQRRYVESLSAYARQFLDQLQKPDVDGITGLSPAIAIEQRSGGGGPRSTVATSTEIHDYLRLLYANIGRAHCPRCGQPVERQSAQSMVDRLLNVPEGTRLVVMAPLVRGRKGTHEEHVKAMRKAGFVRLRVDGDIVDIDDVPKLSARKAHTLEVVVDRLVTGGADLRGRLNDSVEAALKQGGGVLTVLMQRGRGKPRERMFSERYACAACDVSFEPLAPRHFSFNSPYGACPACHGLGTRLEFDASLVVPDTSLSLQAGAIRAWRWGGRRLVSYYRQLLKGLATHYAFDLQTPFAELPAAVQRIVMTGSGETAVAYGRWSGGAYRRMEKPFEGVLPNLQRRYETTDSDYVRQKLRRFMTRRHCTDCGGRRLRPEALACTVGGRSIVEVTAMTVAAAGAFVGGLKLTRQQTRIAGTLVREIGRRLRFLEDVGLGYLTLDRASDSLAGGETQRIRLATQIGSGLSGVLYVLDEPTIGLHVRDTERLVRMLRELRDLGNTVVVVEHDERMIRAADYVVDLGPGAGRHGGEVLVQGELDALLATGGSATASYLRDGSRLAVPATRCRASGVLRVLGARENNLKRIDVEVPLGVFVCVTGVSGSGKSSLVDDVLRRALFRRFYRSADTPGAHDRIEGAGQLKGVVVIDQSPIGRTPRSNPATYTGAFTAIRALFAATPAAKVRGYGPGRFSFNVKGGRCEHCKGDGTLRLEMHFLPDVYVMCEQCGGARYNRETLEIYYGGRTIAEVLAMTVDEALEVFGAVPRVARKLRTLSEVGLGYLQLGQSATTLSGGEAQRVKLAAELSKRDTGRTLYLLDEPTTGLHFADVERLLQVLQRLREHGNTIVVIEHNLDVIKSADHVIDLGPEGGEAGGYVVATGTPEAVAACEGSYTGAALRRVLGGGSGT